jgi:hypothetical protein
MANIDKFRQFHNEATAKVSENTRTLALSAIGLIWLFKHDVAGGGYQMPFNLFGPLRLIVIAMAFDFIQYVYRSIAWHIVFRNAERKLDKGEIKEEDNNLYVPGWVNFMAYGLFYGKVVVLIIAYVELFCFLYSSIIWK